MNLKSIFPTIDNKTKLWIWAIVLIVLIWIGIRLYKKYFGETPGEEVRPDQDKPPVSNDFDAKARAKEIYELLSANELFYDEKGSRAMLLLTQMTDNELVAVHNAWRSKYGKTSIPTLRSAIDANFVWWSFEDNNRKNNLLERLNQIGVVV